MWVCTAVTVAGVGLWITWTATTLTSSSRPWWTWLLLAGGFFCLVLVVEFLAADGPMMWTALVLLVLFGALGTAPEVSPWLVLPVLTVSTGAAVTVVGSEWCRLLWLAGRSTTSAAAR